MRIRHVAFLFRLSASACALLLVAARAGAEVLVVDAAGGPGASYTEIDAAVAAAVVGDVILVRSGTYDGFTLDGKGMTITADAGAEVSVGPSLLTLSAVLNVPSGETARLRGLSFATYWPIHSSPDSTVTISNCAGTVWLEDCSFFSGNASLEIKHCNSVALVRCTAVGGGPFGGTAVASEGSAVYVQDSSLTGGDGQDGGPGLWITSPSPSFPGGDGLRIESGSLWLAGSVLAGGQGGDGYDNLVDCVAPKQGGCGLHLGSGDPLARMAASTLVAGAAGGTVLCAPPAESGVPLTVESGSALSLGVTPPGLAVTPVAREGEFATASVQGAIGHEAFLLLSLSIQPQFLAPFESALLLGEPLLIEPLGTLPVGGSASLLAQIVELGAGLDAAVVGLQAATCDFASGTCTLGTGSTLVALDASF